MNSKIYKTAAVVAAGALGVALFASVVLGACPGSVQTAAGGSVPMKCAWSFKAAAIVSALGVLASLGSILVRGTDGRRYAGVVGLLFAAATLFTVSPLGIGVCANPEMVCVSHSYVIVGGAGFAALASIVQIVCCCVAGAKPRRTL